MNFKFALVAAAVLGAASTAQAADLAKKAPAAANYVKVCDAYGAGFFYIPGSDTCLKIGGFVRAQYNIFNPDKNWTGGTTGAVGWGGANARGKHGIGTFVKADLTVDARTNTELGLLRSFIDFEINSYSGGNGNANVIDAGWGGVVINKAFIQFGGLTAGRAQSFFDFWVGNTYGSWFEPAHSDTNINLLGYTFAFGNGITASLALEDPSSGNAGRRAGADYAGVKTTDVVANLNVSQAWGSAQLMAALHQNYTSAIQTGIAGADVDKWGYAIGGGVTVNLPMLGAGDTFSLQAAYTKGAVRYAAPDDSAGANAANGASLDDFAIDVDGSLHQATAWSIGAGLTHNWTKTVSTSLEASYLDVDQFFARGDFKQLDLQANVVWAPVSGLTIGAELEYRKVDYSTAGVADPQALIGLIRVQRNF